MIILNSEQLADLLREAYKLGAKDAVIFPQGWIGTEAFHHCREHAIHPIVHRFSAGHDDHEREVGK